MSDSTVLVANQVDRVLHPDTQGGQRASYAVPSDGACSVFRLGPWLVVAERHEIVDEASGLVRHLEPRLLRLLVLLASQPDRVFTREELTQALWPKVIVNDNSLTRAVSELRKQLRHPETRSAPSIQTVPKRGYTLRLGAEGGRLTSTMPRRNGATQSRAGSLAEETCATELARQQPVTSLAGDYIRASAVFLSGFAMIALAFLTLQWAGSEKPSVASPRTTPLADSLVLQATTAEPLARAIGASSSVTGAQFRIQAPIIAADGNHYAYIAQDLSGFTIYWGNLSEETAPAPIYSSDRRLSNLAWSPLGNALLFARHESVATALLLEGKDRARTGLYSLNLETLEVRRLEEVEENSEAERGNKVNLTA